MATENALNFDDALNAAWSRLNGAANDPRHPMRLAVVASVTPDDLPDARILVMRGADQKSACVWFHTDARSSKIEQLRTHPNLCVVVYDPAEGVQLRLRGSAALHTDDQLADQHWQQVDIQSRSLYAHPLAPGGAGVHRDPRMQAHMRKIETASPDSGRANFVVVELKASEIDLYQVSRSGHDRHAIMRRDDGWKAQVLS